MASDRDTVTGDGPTAAESEALAEAQRWLARHGVAVPESAPIRADPDPQSPDPQSPNPQSLAPQNRAQRSADGGGRARGNDRRLGHRGGKADASGARAEVPEVMEDPESVARAVVFRKLAVQARTRHELDRALKAKEVPEPVAAQVLDRMEEVGLVDDAVFARDWVESRQRRRQLSRRALRHELETKGVDRDDIDEALKAVDTDEYDVARMLAERKARGMRDLPPDVRYRRMVGALARRGFSGGLTARVITEVLADEPTC